MFAHVSVTPVPLEVRRGCRVLRTEPGSYRRTASALMCCDISPALVAAIFFYFIKIC